ncbi:MAG: hypothetical protein JJLCMIEE_03549 [Acidimicrobiales bacterium]|nr:MAG: hypothetical protein EDR02_18025 [Actinomycetota bacterium]MBV6510409.1 hypothetical protein [Acidimicrobiales bacterium]RIK02537.1 MAG: hypothetical protein DCC48_18050 [Acidobacteriota bacterium]
MKNQDLVANFRRTRDQWDALGLALVPLAEQLAFQAVADVLPGAAVIEVRGEINDDWLRILRIQRVLSGEGDVLFDVAEGHDDRRAEDAIDEANAEYLDLLLDLTGDLYMGNHTLEPVLNAS